MPCAGILTNFLIKSQNHRIFRVRRDPQVPLSPQPFCALITDKFKRIKKTTLKYSLTLIINTISHELELFPNHIFLIDNLHS